MTISKQYFNTGSQPSNSKASGEIIFFQFSKQGARVKMSGMKMVFFMRALFVVFTMILRIQAMAAYVLNRAWVFFKS